MWTLTNNLVVTLTVTISSFLIPILLLSQPSDAVRLNHGQCYTKWLTGYKLASGRPSKVLNSVSLSVCEQECLATRGCSAFAYGISAQSNGTCELAARTSRDSRSVSNNATLTYEDVNKDLAYDVYIESRADGCLPTSPLFQAPSNHLHQQGIPIDCFYRLMSGKRLAKNHVEKSVSVNNLQDCQEACITEKGFVCRAISYRYMPSGYTYNVANCELSPFYLVNTDDSTRARYDFVDDYDYDFFQREPHCKTTTSIGGHFGVCSLVYRKSAKLNNLIKSAHAVSTPSQCEHLCTTALFRCRAFSFRHTERGRERDPFHRRDQQDFDNCYLHDVDISRLPAQNIISDPDHDLFEMGRLMGADCVLYDQYLNRRPGDNYEKDRENRYPYPPSGTRDHMYRPGSSYYDDRDKNRDRDRDRYDYDYHGRRPYDRPQDRVDTHSPYPPRPGTANIVGSSGSGSSVSGSSSGIGTGIATGSSTTSSGILVSTGPITTSATEGNRNPGQEYLPLPTHPRLPPSLAPPNFSSQPIKPLPYPPQQFDRHQDLTSSIIREPSRPPPRDRDRLPGHDHRDRDCDHDRNRDRDRDFDRLRPGQGVRDRLRERERDRDYSSHTSMNGLIQSHGGSAQSVTPSIGSSSVTDDRRLATTEPPFYDKRKEVCLVRLKQDMYLAPDQSRATFPVKTVEECRVECLRSLDVLRFPCKTMSFRMTSSTGGSCQLSDMDDRQLREGDFIPARDRYDNAVIYTYDERADPTCRRDDVSTSGGSGTSGRYYGWRDTSRYQGDSNNRNYDYNSNNRYGGSSSSYYDNRRYDTTSRDRYYSGGSSGSRYDDRFQSSRPSNYDYNTRYTVTDRDRYYPSNSGSMSKGFYDDRRVDDYNRYGYYRPGSSGGGSSSGWTGSSSGGGSSSGWTGSSSSGTRYDDRDRPATSDYNNRMDERTVSGERCMRSCRQNREAGFYYCQVDEAGSWDFCCRPDHFCGYSRGLAVPWCYVGSGPSHNIWRSCNHRALNDRNPGFNPTVSYLHDRLPPTVNSLTNNEVANLTKDNALILFKGSPADFKLDTSSSSSEDYPRNATAPIHVLQSQSHPNIHLLPNIGPGPSIDSSSNLNSNTNNNANTNVNNNPDSVKFGNVLQDETGGESGSGSSNSSVRVNRRTPRKHVRVVKVSKRLTPSSPAAEAV